MKQARIIVLTDIFYPETTSTGYYLTKIAEGLAPHHEVQVICGPATENFKQVQAPRLESINGITIHRCLGTSFNKDNLLGRVINLISKTLSIAVKALSTIQSNDKVLVVTNPPNNENFDYYSDLQQRKNDPRHDRIRAFAGLSQY